MKIEPPTTTVPDEPIELKSPSPELVTDLSQVSEKEGGVLNTLPSIEEERRLDLKDRAKGFVTDLQKFTPGSPEYVNKLREVTYLGRRESISSSDSSNRMLNRASSSLAGAKKSGDDTSIKVASTLGELRSTIQDLSPGSAQKGFRKFLSVMPGGKKINKYFERYESAQENLDSIVDSLRGGKNELEQDVRDLEVEKNNQWTSMMSLRDYAHLTEALRDEVVEQINDLKAAGNIDGAHALETDVLNTINQRYLDITTQLTVAGQGYMAMELIRSNNIELIKGVERAESTTLVALRTSVIVAQALGQQKMVLDQVDAINDATNKMIAQTGANLRSQTERIHKQASSSGVSTEALNKAFEDIFATINAVDNHKIKANDSMSQTIDILSRQIERARPQMERMRALDQMSENGPSSLGSTSDLNLKSLE